MTKRSPATKVKSTKPGQSAVEIKAYLRKKAGWPAQKEKP